MAGNDKRHGARRKEGTKKGPTVGSGGQRRRALQGKGPTPPAEERKAHPAARRAASAAKRAASGGSSQGAGSSRPSGSRPPARRGGPKGEGTELVAGRNSVVEALRARVPATTLYVAERIESDDRVKEALKLAGDLHIPVLEGPRPELDRMTDGTLHQGLVLQVPPYRYATPQDLLERAHDSGRPPLLVALDGVTDPRNLGAAVRSAAAFGAHGVIVPERRSVGMTAGAWKASAGAAARLPVARVTNLTRALRELQNGGVFVAGLDGEGSVEVGELEVASDPLVLVVGSEGKGLSRLVRDTCDLVVRIPIAHDTESLNAGIAASIALYEVARRRAA
ncbi:23S rRNA (guanosine2251-2'-O)-methyltransferase [Motilibacter rhizosphaerae]|uniref:23S rRNA (Guanosine2251-2'-O)-methyltransferase n=1 Tax=Motilibacter rhizosphaerae TaxID=598652 RepID=A0A4Q7NR49_9ACTN|nr:23S rRNA (guanosine(2251)-2'-O)-methyltransferase RlmB [Motilibacter rhizosphaerae]RZS87598.1 23S rRNA (guanosine2251-2'-O)-methyltransferase [Motilibacter rhizosphaerae]